MIKRIKFTAIILVLIASFSWPKLLVQADYQIPDIGIEYDVPTEVVADQYVHLPGPVNLDGGGTSGRNGYGYVLMPSDLPDQTKLTVSELHDVDLVENKNGKQITRCGEAYTFNVQIPDGTNYNESFSITLPYCNGLSDPDIYTHDETKDNWARENGTFDYSFYDITTKISKLSTHGVFSTEQIDGEIEDISADAIDNEHKEEINNEIDDKSEDELSDKNDIDNTPRGNEITLTINEELLVYADQNAIIENTGSRIIMPTDLPDETTIKVEDANDADFVIGADGLNVSGDVFTVMIMTPDGTNFED